MQTSNSAVNIANESYIFYLHILKINFKPLSYQPMTVKNVLCT